MTNTAAMLEDYPGTVHLDRKLLIRAIDEALVCFQTCTACADACLGEDTVLHLTTCVRACLDCATICAATVEVLSRQTGYDADLTRGQLQACIAACKAAGDECEHLAQMHRHCGICAAVCRSCEQACRALLAVGTWTTSSRTEHGAP